MALKVATSLGATSRTNATLAWVTDSPWIAGDATVQTSRMARSISGGMSSHSTNECATRSVGRNLRSGASCKCSCQIRRNSRSILYLARNRSSASDGTYNISAETAAPETSSLRDSRSKVASMLFSMAGSRESGGVTGKTKFGLI